MKIFDKKCVLSLIYNYVVCMWIPVYYVVALLSALCILLFMFWLLFLCFSYSFYFCFPVLYVLLSALFVFCFCIVLCIVASHVICFFISVYKFTVHCHVVKTQLQLINIISHFFTLALLSFFLSTQNSSLFPIYLHNRQVHNII